MKKVFTTLMIAALMLSCLASCGKNTSTKDTDTSSPDASASEEGGVVVGLSINSIADTWNTYLMAAMQKACDEAGATLLIEDSYYDSSKQLAGVENLCVRDVDVMMVVPVETTACDEITSTCANYEVPLVYVNMQPDTPQENTWFIGSEEWDAGQLQGEILKEHLNPGDKVGILLGQIGTHATTQRTDSVKECIVQIGAEVLDEQEGKWDRTKAMSITEDWIILYGDELKAVASNNDDMALGAIEALTAANMNDVVVVGVDGTPDGIAAVKEGSMAATAFQNAFAQGEEAIAVSLQVVAGEDPQAETWVPFELITQENADEFLQMFKDYGF